MRLIVVAVVIVNRAKLDWIDCHKSIEIGGLFVCLFICVCVCVCGLLSSSLLFPPFIRIYVKRSV